MRQQQICTSWSMGDLDGALRCYIAGSMLHPTFSYYPMMIGKMFAERNNFEQDIRMYQRALELQGKWDNDEDLGMFDMHFQTTIENEIDLAYKRWSNALGEKGNSLGVEVGRGDSESLHGSETTDSIRNSGTEMRPNRGGQLRNWELYG